MFFHPVGGGKGGAHNKEMRGVWGASTRASTRSVGHPTKRLRAVASKSNRSPL